MLPAAHQSYLKKEQVSMGWMNLIMNGFFAWLIFKALKSIPLWGLQDSIAFDLSITGFLLGFLVCLGVSFGSRKKISAHNLKTLSIKSLGLAGRLPQSLFARSLRIGFLGLGMSWITIAGVALAGASSLSLYAYIILKAIAACIYALICNHFTVIRAFADAEHAASIQVEKA